MQQIPSNIDQDTMECYQFNDGSIYHGQFQVINDKKVRNGYGIQIITVKCFSQEQPLYTKYQGYWENGLRHGQGTTWYHDNSVYKGNMNYGIKQGQGVMKWFSGDQYEGEWNKGLMEGNGVFTHRDDFILEGTFFQNYYIKSDQLYVNPFLSKQELKQFEENILDQQAKKQALQPQYWFYFVKTQTIQENIELIKKSNNNNRYLLCVLEQQMNISIEQFCEEAKQIGQKINIFDIQLINYHHKTSPTKYKEYLNQMKLMLARSMFTGEIVCINMDDQEIQYDNSHDVSMKEFHSESHFPQEIWNLKLLKRKELFGKIYSQTQYDDENSVHQDFQIFVWSKFKISTNELDKKIVETFEKRFSSVLPTDVIDLALIENIN